MTIEAGTQLDQYRLVEKIGEGGMGVVWKAYDTTLDRDVAVKVLPESFADDEDLLARFEREAKAVAALSHPNIVGIFGFGTASGRAYAAMELLEGQVLRDLLDGGSLPPRKAVDLARQIADGLDAAHAKGIVHRDLKPDNIFVTADGRARILDFGLATAATLPGGGGESGNGESGNASALATLPELTTPGTILGTIGYMSPEQVRGESADSRSDIFSLGMMLLEMLSGERPFARATQVETMTAILREDPPAFSLGDRPAPPTLDRVVRRCLEKSADERFQSARDLAFALDHSMLDSSSVAPLDASTKTERQRHRAPWFVALVTSALAVAAVLYATSSRRTPEPHPVVRSTIDIPEPLRLDQGDRAIALSSDGAALALVLSNPVSEVQQLFVRPLDELELRPLEGTEGATYPFWSPDGRSLGFFADGKLKRIDLRGGIVRTLTDAPAGRGAAWSPHGFIVFQPSSRGALFRISADGGSATAFTTTQSEGEDHRLPHFLLDGRTVLFRSKNRGSPGEDAIYAFDPDRDEAKRILSSKTDAFFAEPDHLLFLRDGILMSQPFDLEELNLTGAARPLESGVNFNIARRYLSLGIASDGRLVYGETPKLPGRHFYWLDADGSETPTDAEPIHLVVEGGRVSPDGRRLALTTVDSHGFYRVNSLDFDRGTLIPLGDPTAYAFGVAWSHDGDAVVLSATIDGDEQLLWTRAQAGGDLRPLTSKIGFEYAVGDFAPDGRFLLSGRHAGDKLGDVWLFDTEGDTPERLLLGGPGDESAPRISPDGRRLAYLSGASGGLEVWLTDFPSAQQRRPVSTRFHYSEDGRSGERVRLAGFGWMSDDEVYWRDLEGQVWATKILDEDGEIEIGPRRPLFDGRALSNEETLLDFSAARQKFLLARTVGTAPSPRLVFVSDWRAALDEGSQP